MKYITLAGLILSSYMGFGQYANFTATPQTLSNGGECERGKSVVVQVAILNTGGTPLRRNSVLATLDIPINGEFDGFIPDSSSTQFVVSSVSGGKIEMINSGGDLGDALSGSSEAYMYFKIKGISDGTVVFPAKVEFNYHNGPDSLASYALQGNQETEDDRNTTALKVTAPLSVNFTDISAQWNSSDAKVLWTVAQESGTNYFGVERSFDGKNFENVGKVKSKGDHKDELLYSFTDEGAKSKTSNQVFYRVREVASNGDNTLSKVVVLANKQAHAGLAYVYPNPISSNSAFTFVYENDITADLMLDLNISDALGRSIYRKSVAVKQGKNEIPVQGITLSSGMYHLSYSNVEHGINASLKMVKD